MNSKIEEICQEMTQEVAKVDQNYSSLHTKVDIVADVVTKIVKYHTSLLNKVDVKFESDSKEFVRFQALFGELKDLILKISIPPSSLFSQDLISQMHSSLETRLKDDLDPLLKFVNLMPKSTPPVSTGVQGEKRVLVHQGIQIKEKLLVR